MNRYQLLIVGLLALAGVFVFMTLRPAKTAEQQAVSEAAASAAPARPSAPARAAVKSERTHAKPTAKDAQETAAAAAPEAAEQPAVAAGETKQAGAAAAEKKTPREKAVAAWESVIDQVIEQKKVPAADQAKRVKEAFDTLDKEDQMDGIHRSLNLLPDEQFPALYGILFDKAENREVLDAIFSDALNRPEDIKNPLMKELRKDREHPMFFESARILDVVETPEEKAQQK